MSKNKILILVSFIFIFLCMFSVTCFANDTMKSATDTVVDGINNVGSSVRNGISSVENGIEGALNMKSNTAASSTSTLNTANNNNYVATRTAATAIDPNTSTLWTWIIVGIAGIVIIGLVWYYAAENKYHE